MGDARAKAAFDDANRTVTTYRYNGEALGLQDKPVLGLLVPDSVGKRVVIDSKQHPFRRLLSQVDPWTNKSSVERHKIEYLIKGLDPRRKLGVRVEK